MSEKPSTSIYPTESLRRGILSIQDDHLQSEAIARFRQIPKNEPFNTDWVYADDFEVAFSGDIDINSPQLTLFDEADLHYYQEETLQNLRQRLAAIAVSDMEEEYRRLHPEYENLKYQNVPIQQKLCLEQPSIELPEDKPRGIAAAIRSATEYILEGLYYSGTAYHYQIAY